MEKSLKSLHQRLKNIMEMQTIQKYIHATPRKLRLVADIVRKMEPVKALDTLRVTRKDAAKDLSKALETVLANIRQAGADLDKLSFKSIEINESVVLRRFKAGTRGRAKPYKRRMSHIRIVLTDDVKLKTQSSKLKSVIQKPKLEEEKGEKQ